MQEYRVHRRKAAREALECYLLEQELKPYDRLPSERDLCQLWGFNRCTLRRALCRMVQEGELISRKGSGTFVAPPKIERRLQDLKSFSASLKEQGHQVENRLIYSALLTADQQLAHSLDILPGDRVFQIDRLRVIDSAPLAIEVSAIPYARTPGLEQYDLEHRSLFEVLEQEYGLPPAMGEEHIGITYASQEEAWLLGLAPDSAVFWIVSKTLDEKGRPLEYCKSVARADRLQLTSILTR